MANEFNPDPWRHGIGPYVDRTYPSGVAQERPKLTTRIHCEPEREQVMREAALSGPAHERGLERAEESRAFWEADQIHAESRVDWFNHALRSGQGFRNEGDE